ncbi:MAG: hypothetical protein CVU89_07190 [Firmicutes bacterium HGW-Firmicutes-14]|nr:MAG: hypothetical protein CVU89_07190 [Firmicutes bacterium HGW-Firmicutes-14]
MAKKLPTYKNCFICGTQNEIGLQARFWTEGELAFSECRPDSRYEGYKGIIHGGVVSAMLDETMGKAIMAAGGPMAMTAKLNVRFRKSALVGRKLTFEGEWTGKKRVFYETRGRALNESGEVVAEATGLFVEVPEEESNEIIAYLDWK